MGRNNEPEENAKKSHNRIPKILRQKVLFYNFGNISRNMPALLPICWQYERTVMLLLHYQFHPI